MARFEIKSKDGNSVRYSGKPRYNGSYLRPSYIEFSEVSSPTPIDWEVGDYVDYIRTGMRYRLYSIPQPSKNAKMGSCGNAFTYSNVQFYAATKELEIALFKDLVSSDNNIHFSTSPDVNTYEDIYGIARRIQACMDYFYPNRWQIKVADFDETNDAEIIEKVSTAKDFSLSNGTCLDALSKIYELWQDIGWIHTYENGKETITIGYTSKRIESNTTSPFIYGKGNGLTAIRRNQINKDEFATRLYVYGSERNLPTRYYNGKDILNAESVDIRNLMLPLDKWGQTDGKPDARKAYLENAEAVAKYGVIPKTHYFDSEEAGADIYPSIKGMTIGDVRNALSALGETLYYPSRDIYKDSSARVDQLLGGSSMIDDGVISKDGKEFDFNVSFDVQESTTMGYILPGYAGKATVLSDYVLWGGNLEQGGRGTITVNPNVVCKISVEQPYAGVTARVVVTNSEHPSYRTIYGEGVFEGIKRDGTNNWEIDLGAVSADYINKEYESFPVYVLVSIVVSVEDTTTVEDGVGITFRSGSIDVSYKKYLAKSFNLSLRQIGFNINERANAGKGKSISIKTGPCAGRSFEITACKYYPTGDSWVLTCKRQRDNTLGVDFPNIDYQIEMGNEFVLTDIAMPEIYIYAGMQRLLSEGNKLLAQASKIQNTYEPSIDAKVMIESGRTLREGMFMEITDGDVVDGTTDYILIDTLSIYEDESAIPTYKVTLKERRKVTYKGTPSATSSTDTQPVEEDHTPQANVDLSAYAKQEDLSSLEKRVASEEETTQKYQSWWDKVMSHLTVDDNGNVTIDTNLIVSGDTASGGAGEDITVGLDEKAVLDLLESKGYVTEEDIEGLIPDDYVNSAELTEIVNEINAKIAKKADSSALQNLQNEVDNIEAVLGMDEEAEGVINTWNEVKAFLDGYSSSDDLATILSSMNADIAKRALQSELEALGLIVDGHTSSISTINGNITNLTNNKADKTSVYTKTEIDSKVSTINDAINGIDGRVDIVEAWKDLLGKYIVIEGTNVRIKTNLVIDGDAASGGSGEDIVVGIQGIKVNNDKYNDSGDGYVDLTDAFNSIDVSGELANYYTKGEVDGKIANFATTDALTSGLLVKVDKVDGKALSTNDFTDALLTKLNGIAEGAEVNVQSDWNATSGDAFIKNKPTIPTNTNQLDNGAGYITSSALNGYATQSWVNEQGFAKASAIPTLKSLMGATAIGGTTSYIYWNGSAWATKALGDRAFDSTAYQPLATAINTGNIGSYAPIYDADKNVTIQGNFMANSLKPVNYLWMGDLQESYYLAKTGIYWHNSANAYVSGLMVFTQSSIALNQPTTINADCTMNGNLIVSGDVASGGAGQETTGYLPLSGGILTGRLFIQPSNDNPLVLYSNKTDAAGATRISFYDANQAFQGYVMTGWGNLVLSHRALRQIGVGDSGIWCSNDNGTTKNALIHAGNIGSYAPIYDADKNVTIQGYVIANLLKPVNYLWMGDLQESYYLAKNGIYWHNSANAYVSGLMLFTQSSITLNQSTSVNANLFVTGSVGIGTTDLYNANKLRLVNTHSHRHTWSLGYLAQESDLSVEFTDTRGSDVYGLYTSINYYTGYVAMQVGRSDGLTNAYGLILQPLGGNVLIGTAVDAGYKLNVNGTFYATSVSQGSDIRFKHRMNDVTLDLDVMANAPLFNFYWNDRADNQIHIGTSAQYWETYRNELVSGTDFKGLDYSTLGVAMGISLAKKVKELEAEIKRLKEVA